MQLLISDANVLIDIEHGKLTTAMFSLPYEFAVPDVLFVEELQANHAHLVQYGLSLKTMTGEMIEEVYQLRQRYSRPSTYDLLAFVLAKHENCQLLTGDKALREVARQYQCEVHGTLWLVQKMIEYECIAVEVAEDAFECMRISGSRLPWSEVEAMLDRKLNVLVEIQ